MLLRLRELVTAFPPVVRLFTFGFTVGYLPRAAATLPDLAGRQEPQAQFHCDAGEPPFRLLLSPS